MNPVRISKDDSGFDSPQAPFSLDAILHGTQGQHDKYFNMKKKIFI